MYYVRPGLFLLCCRSVESVKSVILHPQLHRRFSVEINLLP